MPSDHGASATSHGGRQQSHRQGRGVKSLGETSSSPPQSASQSGVPGAAGRPLSPPSHVDGDKASRKRKRRRRSKKAAAGGTSTAASAQAQASVPASPSGDGQSASVRKARKNRNRRSLQGRPLAKTEAPTRQQPAGKSETPTPAPAPAKHTDHRRISDTDAPAPLYAALDLGTNNCRLLIAQPTRPGQFRVVDAFSRIVRLGEGLAASGRLSQDAMDRSIEALKICASKLKARNIRRHRLIATEACRAAENGEAFLERVTLETGLELEIINRETEARLAVSGCASLVGYDAKSVVLFDIGGGSSEIAVIRIGANRSGRLANHITHWTSLPVGVVTLSERHGGKDVTPESFAAMVAEVEGMLASFQSPAIDVLTEGNAAQGFHLIGTSGTVTTLAGVHLDLPRYDRRRVDGVWLSDDEVTAMQSRLLSWNFTERAANPCIGPDRADLVLAGCAILEAIRKRWPSTRMRVADRGLREGLLTDMMADDGAWRQRRQRRHNNSQHSTHGGHSSTIQNASGKGEGRHE
ncbi:Ppx/GppA family phosphatase [Rhizobium sp. CFBP 8762]|nr:Ppx/GppA phosphatase family protein [Rhizobium sp. CFBP 8762]MBD8553379.1 Ppx/GppA family phosphatase [Rhizobium sp. CFBP 8762]